MSNASLPFVEIVFPSLDNETLFQVLVLAVCGGLALLLLWWVGARGLEPGIRGSA
jgi:hypothetical protein